MRSKQTILGLPNWSVEHMQAKASSITADLSHIATSKSHEELPTEEKVEALTEIICRSGDDPATRSAALLVLIAMVESSPHPRILAAVAKQVALARCWELNVCGMVESQIVALEHELFAGNIQAA